MSEPLATDQYVFVYCRSDADFRTTDPSDHATRHGVEAEPVEPGDDHQGFVTYASSAGGSVELEWLGRGDETQVAELESDAASVAAADLPGQVKAHLLRLVETETRAVAAMLPSSREDLELAFALAGWFVAERDGVLATEDLGFHLDGVWHAVPDPPDVPRDDAAP